MKRRQAFARTLVQLGLVAFVLMAAASAVHAGGGPENVLLVVNPRGPGSLEVANHYIALRHIPPQNVVYIPFTPTGTSASGLQFREKILKPILDEMKRRKLEGQIDQIVYSCDYPFSIDFTKDFPGLTLPKTNRPIVSLNAATFFYKWSLEANPHLVGGASNNYAAALVPGPLSISRGFRAEYEWGAGGARVASGGARYLLSTVLGSSGPSGNTPHEMITYLERAATADGTRPPGTFYFMKNQNVRSVVRQETFHYAAAELRVLGLRAVEMPGIVPTGKGDILGLTTGAENVRLAEAHCHLMPGALVDNLTSHGGMMVKLPPGGGQTRVSEYLRLGAAGASGTVVEPFAIPAKFPSPTLHVHYARGCSMAESFYQSVVAPFQLLIAGDPLCQPWAAIPRTTVEGVPLGGLVSGKVELTPTALSPRGAAIKTFQLFVDGMRREECKPGYKLTLDTTTLADGWHEVRVVAIDDTPIETQGRWIGEVIVKNGRTAVQLSSPRGPRVSGPQISVAASSTTEGPVVISHNGREVARIRGGSGTASINASVLGRGPVELTASVSGESGVASRPLRLEVE